MVTGRHAVQRWAGQPHWATGLGAGLELAIFPGPGLWVLFATSYPSIASIYFALYSSIASIDFPAVCRLLRASAAAGWPLPACLLRG